MAAGRSIGVMSELPAEYRGLAGLVRVVARLRGPGGCPWDAEQTHASLVQYLVEETYELIEAIEAGGRDDLIEELGDVLYQVLFHADLAKHTIAEQFDIDTVAEHMARKMISRHPHVFGEASAETAEDVMKVWDDLKAKEKPHRTSVLDGVPQGMPALALGQKLLAKAKKLGVAPAEGIPAPGWPTTEGELGEQLMALTVRAADAGFDAERAMRHAVRNLADRIRATESNRPAPASLPE